MPTTQSNHPTAAAPATRADDLAQIIEAYNGVTEKMQASHERLQAEVVRLRRELTSANVQLQRSKRLSALGEMAAGIAHEIRNPLAAIQLYIGMVIDDLGAGPPASDQALDNARKIASAVQGMGGIVSDVLSFARGIEPDRRPCDVSALFDQALLAHQPAIEASGVVVVRRDRDRGDRGDVVMVADPGLVKQAVLNLVRNAVDAMTGQAQGPRELVLDVVSDEVGPVLVVRDTGPGIPEEQVDRIFNPFFTTRSTGTGLGLAIVHRIVDAHGGAVSVVNDGGAVFQLSFPQPQPGEQSGGQSGGQAEGRPGDVEEDKHLSRRAATRPGVAGAAA